MIEYDVVIIGGGVAGCATAISLKQHRPMFSVAIVERGAYDRARIGETLLPHTVVLLEQLELWKPFLRRGALPAHGTCAAWGQPDPHHNEFIFTPYGHGWHVDRQSFDKWLSGEAQRRGADVLTNSHVVKYHKRDDDWFANVRRSTNEIAMRARFVVDATGRLADFSRQQGARKVAIDQLVGIFRFFQLHDGQVNACTMIEADSHGWWYSALLPDDRLAVALMTDADIAQRHQLRSERVWDDWLEKTRHTCLRLTDAEPTMSPTITAAHTQYLDQVCGSGWLAAGDAASTVDPLSSLGIFKALRTGIHASYAVMDYLDGKEHGLPKYEKLVRAEFDAYRHKRREYYRLEQRWSDSPFWQRRHEMQPARTAITE